MLIVNFLKYIIIITCNGGIIVDDLGENGLPIVGWAQSSSDFHIGTKNPFSIKCNISLYISLLFLEHITYVILYDILVLNNNLTHQWNLHL